MKKIMLLMCSLTLIAGLIFFGAGIAGATLIGPEWPAPGGTTYTSSGAAGGTGGLTYSYSGFDNSQYASLYWGPWENAPIGASLNGAGLDSTEYMTFGSFTGNVATWTGSSTWSYYIIGGTWHYNQSIDTRFTLTVNPMNFLDAGTLGKPAVEVLAPVDGNFTANLLFEANFFGTWRPVNVGFNMYQTSSNTHVNFSGGFYHEPVPEPSTMLLLGAGLLGLVGIGRKRYIKK